MPCSAAVATIARSRASAPSTPPDSATSSRLGAVAEADVYLNAPGHAVEALHAVAVERLAVVRHQDRPQALAHVERPREVGIAYLLGAVHQLALGQPAAQRLRARELLVGGPVLVDLRAVHEALHQPERLRRGLPGADPG